MQAIAPLFFEDLAQVFGDYVVIAACRVTDDADAGRGRENFTVELFVKHFAADTESFKKLDAIRQRMKPFRTKILPARNKLAAHADRAAVSGASLGTASWEEWAQFWSDLADFVRALNEEIKKKPFEIDAGGVMGDAEMLLKALAHAQHFEALLNSSDPAVQAACLELTLPTA
jgi:AbiU2